MSRQKQVRRRMVLPVVEGAASPYGLIELVLMLDHYIDIPHRPDNSTEEILQYVSCDVVAVVLLLALSTWRGCGLEGY